MGGVHYWHCLLCLLIKYRDVLSPLLLILPVVCVCGFIVVLAESVITPICTRRATYKHFYLCYTTTRLICAKEKEALPIHSFVIFGEFVNNTSLAFHKNKKKRMLYLPKESFVWLVSLSVCMDLNLAP